MRTLADLHDTHSGQSCAIIANGPTLGTHDYSAAVLSCDISIGVHYAWEAMDLDYWVCIDSKPFRYAREHMSDVRIGGDETWVIRSGIGETGLMHTDDDVIVHEGYIDSRNGILHGMETKGFCETGRFPGQRIPAGSKESMIRGSNIYMHHSSVMPALHLALVMGVEEIVLVAVDCGGELMSSYDSEPITEVKIGDMAIHRRQLDEFWVDWAARVKLSNASPVYHGLWPKWEAA